MRPRSRINPCAASVAQVALAWLLHQKVVSSVLVGAKRMEQFEDNLKVTKIVLSDEDLAAINEASKLPPEYPGWMLAMWSQIRAGYLANSKR
ncbi:aldo/keto reductase [Rhizobium sp. P38BS-XIX]|uniref:aldo/keto reductase n=1 Tax=Rhizobium sp. P38BS-XIX TaxID=2726740 RepID=UPI001457351B|nr:aldo/keto reductase [Rhizobium sp. P38BS-XIX]